METLLNYLDNMFANYPQTPEVTRAKDDLAEMMEDKYCELIAEGRIENEAIGIVISEFGNIRELAEELGIQPVAEEEGAYNEKAEQKTIIIENKPEENQEQNIKGFQSSRTENQEQTKRFDSWTENHSKKNLRQLSVMEVEEYLFTVKQSSLSLAAGVFLCICSPVFLLILYGIQEFLFPISDSMAAGAGVTVLLFMVACAVGLFIRSGMKLEAYKYLKTDCFTLDENYEKELYLIRESKRGKHSAKIAAGVILCILSVVPVILSSFIAEHAGMDFIIQMSVVLLLMIVGIAVFLFITTGMEMDSYKVILQEEEFSMKKKSRQQAENILCAIYWPAVIIIYLAASFISGGWAYTWLIWPLSAIVFDFICKIIEAGVKEY